MDLYILDDLYRRTDVVDLYQSLIWTERYKAWGDFELTIRSNRGSRAQLPLGTKVGLLNSHRVCTVEAVEDSVDDSGLEILKVSGRSIEAVLEDRANRNSFASNVGPAVNWEITDTPGNVIRTVFNDICRYNGAIPEDTIPLLTDDPSFLPTGSIPEPTDEITVLLEADTVYNSIQKIADLYNLGFRLVREYDTGKLHFDVYTGNDRTTGQIVNNPVVFSPKLDNLSGVSEFTSNADSKNIAYVFAKNGSAIVPADNVDPSVFGFSRRVLIVNADNIDLAPGPALDAAMTQRGKEELAKHRGIIAFDGEIPQFDSRHIYDMHYGLGDIVELRNDDGYVNNMRVSEQIFTSDREGVRSFPTLSLELLITPGSWLGWDANQEWIDAIGYWADA